jgi:hypothetical protein
MTTTKKSVPRAVAVLKQPTKVAALIPYAQGIEKSLTNNPSFPNLAPTLAQLDAAITALAKAQAATHARTMGAVETRNEAQRTLVAILQQLRGTVQGVADATPENAPSIIASAGMSVRKTPARPPRVFNAAPGLNAGTAKLVAASAGHRASYEWEYSADGGKTWVAATPSLQAKTVVSGLPSGNTVQFRYRAVTKTGTADWSQPVSLLVK